MPNLANIVIKKADGTTDATYVAVQGASGTSPAIFRNTAVGTTILGMPSMTVTARDNGPRNARRVDVNFSWPHLQVTDGVEKVIGRTSGTASFAAPLNQTPALIKEQAFQFGNLLGSLLIKQSFEEGSAPRA